MLRRFKKQPFHNVSFLNILPSDILLDIFSHFNRSDCLTCMSVCRSWYNAIPQYCQEQWTELRFCRNDIYTTSKGWTQCIGNHVKRVIFDFFHNEREIYAIVKKLIANQCHKVEHLEFVHCTISDQAALLRMLKQFAQLTELKFESHSNNSPFLHVIHACPRLLRFTYTSTSLAYLDGLYSEEPKIKKSSLPMSFKFIHLNYLCLDAIMDKRTRLHPILQKCPNLRYLICTNATTPRGLAPCATSYRTTIVDLDYLPRWCPNLVYFETNTGRPQGCQDAWHDYLERSKSLRQGLRYFLTKDGQDYPPETIATYLKQNERTLEYLNLGRYYGYEVANSPLVIRVNWSTAFHSMSFPQLHSLICDDILADNDSLTALLRNCPRLEKLVLSSALLTLVNLPQMLQGLNHLKQLELSYLRLRYDDSQNTVHQFRDLSASGSIIEHVRICDVDMQSDELIQGFTQLRTLKTLVVRANGSMIPVIDF